MSRGKVHVGVIILMGVLGYSGDSSADSKLPGLACKWYGPQGDDTYFNPSGFSANGIKNTYWDERYVACPIPKNPSDWTDDARIILNTPWATCSFYARSYGVNYSYTSAPGSVTEIEPGYWQYLFDPVGYWNHAGMSVSFYCRVPSDGAIINYSHRGNTGDL